MIALRAPIVCPTRFVSRFAQDEDGGVTVEAVIWLPVFFFVLMMITDASMAFFSRAQAYRILESGNRAFSLSDTSTKAVTETWIETQFRNQFKRASAANVDAVTTTDKTGGTVSTTLTYRARDVVPFNTLGVMSGWTISVQAQQFVEWSLS
jgi:Flp pilus assembly protein TadG